MTPTPTPVAAAALPTFERCPCGTLGRWVSPDNLAPNAFLDQLDALREEVARLTKEGKKLEFAIGGWKEMFWAVARELNCLPSTFWDGNAHVLKAAIKLNAELAALKARPADVDALMALADDYAESFAAQFYTHCPSDNNPLAAREALRAKLAARKEDPAPLTQDEIYDRIAELKDLLP